MKRTTISPIVIVIALLAVVGCQHGRNVEVARVETDPKIAKIRELLVANAPGSLLPELDAASPAGLATGDVGASLLAWGRGAAATAEIPETTYTLYRRFKTAGERPPYEGPYFAKRRLLTQEVVAAWLGQDDSRISRINDLIWNICEETTWVAPAHENDSWTIDLFSAETAADLAHVLLVLGDRLPEEIRDRVRAEIKKRILDPYLEHGNQYWWTGGSNNWTGVCAGSVGQTFLMIEDDLDRQAQGLALVLEQLGRFIEHGFEPDGGCLEGIGYWNYGLSQYMAFAEMLRTRTGGAIDLLADEKVKAIARYPLAVFLGNDRYASFSDAHDTASVDPFIGARLAERADAHALLGLIGGTTDWRFSNVLRNLLWWDGKTAAAPPIEDALLLESGVAKLVGRCGDKPVVLVIKAGHNAEPHNHNDVGSFVFSAGGTIYLCDPGPGLYSAE